MLYPNVWFILLGFVPNPCSSWAVEETTVLFVKFLTLNELPAWWNDTQEWGVRLGEQEQYGARWRPERGGSNEKGEEESQTPETGSLVSQWPSHLDLVTGVSNRMWQRETWNEKQTDGKVKKRCRKQDSVKRDTDEQPPTNTPDEN